MKTTEQAAEGSGFVVYVVLRNGEVDEVFDNPEAAQLHQHNLTAKWNLTRIIPKLLKAW